MGAVLPANFEGSGTPNLAKSASKLAPMSSKNELRRQQGLLPIYAFLSPPLGMTTSMLRWLRGEATASSRRQPYAMYEPIPTRNATWPVGSSRPSHDAMGRLN
jgi:hypothetical protein